MTHALIIGATGLVGGHLTRQLLDDPKINKISIFVRRPTGLTSPKLHEHIVNYDKLEDWREHLKGDVLFSALGTTRKKAGSKEAQYKVDYTYQHDIAKAAAEQGVPSMVLLSSSGANAKSNMFYTRIKGELEEAVRNMGFTNTTILQPSVLVGERDHERPGETVGKHALNFAAKILPFTRAYRPIEGATVARAMRQVAHKPRPGCATYKLGEIFTLADSI